MDQPQHYSLPECLLDAGKSCEAFMVPAPDGRQQIIVAGLKTYERAVVFALSDAGAWQPIGSLPTAISCEAVRQALRQGSYRWVAPPQMDLEAGPLRLPVTPWPSSRLECH